MKNRKVIYKANNNTLKVIKTLIKLRNSNRIKIINYLKKIVVYE